MNAPASTPTTKRCPGFAPGGIEPHELPATREHFASNAGNKDGLATRCKACGNLYGSAWAAAKRKGEKFSARRVQEPATGGPPPLAPPEPAGFPVVSPLREEPPAEPRVLASPSKPPQQYADPLAVKAHRGKAPGYTSEEIGGVIYALPEAPAVVNSPEGQVALAACNEARAAERRRRNTLAKREQRAAAKRRAEEAAQA